ncbi:AraC family transcriptional regulator [Rhizobium sp. EC-SD404]|uniref:AraC family transcriptional regulator n=1 Tax=Rhizobium sp. EC-SD404 TaxID=2038389 RepID=UPI0012558E20|nr:AraC family transcriptional regulator [Rhizobium sp. EC-SD404]VVT19810.1 L-rhamnose operon regulatory protein RhaS [Rhizobium sp. EC-SD404]
MTIENDIAKLRPAVIAYADSNGAGEQPLMTSIPGLSIVRSRQATDIEPMVYQPLLCFVLQGAKESVVGDMRVRFAEGQSLIVGLDLPAESRVVLASEDRPYLAIAVGLDVAMMRELAAQSGLRTKSDGSEEAENCQTLQVGVPDAALVDAMARLFALVDQPEALILAPLVIREIHYRVLSAGHAGVLRMLARADSHVSRIANVLATIKDRYDEPLKVEELASTAGMSTSAFHEHFKAVTRTTPLQFQKRLRLIEARRLMFGGSHSVTRAAFAVGYESASQFSREYSRHFGVAPSDDRAFA